MTISNFSNDNYLIGNDLWVTVNGFANLTKRLKLKVKNLVNNKFYDLVLYPNPNNQFQFNITSPVRALFDAPDHASVPLNTLAGFEITLTAEFVGAFANDILVINKNFIRGFREGKSNSLKNFLNTGDFLFIGKWKNIFSCIGFADEHLSWQLLPNNTINYNPSPLPVEREDIIIECGCNYKIIKFLNSLGGYQYYLFENYEIKENSKPLKNVPKITNNFNDTAFRSLGTELNKAIELITENSAEDQIIITELIKSHDVLMWDAETELWIKLVPNANATPTNTWDGMYKNIIKFDFYNEVNNSLIW